METVISEQIDEGRRRILRLLEDGGGKVLGGYRASYEQVTIYHLEKHNPQMLVIVFSNVNDVDQTVTVQAVEAIPFLPQIHDHPINLLINIGEHISEIKRLAVDIVSFKLPLPPQQAFLLEIAENPNSTLTQAILSVCHKQVCLCPLMFTVGCVEWIDTPVVPTKPMSHISYSYEPKGGWNQRKHGRLMLTALRQFLPFGQIRAIIEEVRERAETEEFIFEQYERMRGE